MRLTVLLVGTINVAMGGKGMYYEGIVFTVVETLQGGGHGIDMH